MEKHMGTFIAVDDHPAILNGIEGYFSECKDHRCVGTAETYDEAVTLCRQECPDFVILDIVLKERNGFDLCREILRICPDAKPVFASMHVNYGFISKAFRSGARGFISKDAGRTEYIEAADKIMNGKLFLDQTALEILLEVILKVNQKDMILQADPYHTLTDREREIFIELAKLRKPKEIAYDLGMSPKTAHNHRLSIYKKLDLHTEQEIVTFAIERGLISER
jgi:DNA-binding NarL/FixJ family response regulator